jgi:L-ascorbate metabolism protein UlaG (beta-lactamase superfamily)
LGLFSIFGIPAAHEQLETDENGNYKYLSYIVVVGGRTIFHSGDACPYPGLGKILQKWKIDVAVLPINVRDPKRGVPGNIMTDEAVALGKEMGARIVIPCHYEMFAFNSVSPQGSTSAAENTGLRYCLLEVGERYSI